MIRIYSILAFFLQLCLVFLALLRAHAGKSALSELSGAKEDASGLKFTRYLVPLIIAAGVFLRVYRLGSVPYGLNNDEASIGYDAWALATFGVDRNGYPWPVYPITWGSGGGGPVVIYLAVLTERLFGHSILALRLPSAVLGCLTLPLWYLLIRMTLGRVSAVAALMLLSFNPWHIMMSRFTLDCNTFAFWLVTALLLYVLGLRYEKVVLYLLSAAVFALCLYVYGSATVVIPVFLLIFSVLCVRMKRLHVKTLLLSVLTFLIVLSPLLLFYGVNALDLPAIVTAHFSVPRFVTSRSVFYAFDSDLPRNMLKSLLYTLRFLTTGPSDTEVVCNQMPGYGVFYRFTFLLTFAGLFVSLKQLKTGFSPIVCANLILFASSCIFTLFLRPEISRMTLFLLPVLVLQTLGIRFLYDALGRKGAFLALASVCLGAVLFTKNYFGRYYADISSQNFMPGYGEAVRYADALWQEEDGTDCTVYSTYRHLVAPFSVALYYTQTPVQDFIDTVQYRDEVSDARIAIAFTHFVFGLPEDVRSADYRNDILIVHREELDDYPESAYEITIFENYAVLTPRRTDR